MTFTEMKNLASIYKEEILNSYSPGSRKIVHESTVEEKWVDIFIKRHTDSVQQRKSKTVELVRFLSFNAHTVSTFFLKSDTCLRLTKSNSPIKCSIYMRLDTVQDEKVLEKIMTQLSHLSKLNTPNSLNTIIELK